MKKILLIIFLIWPWKVFAHNFQLKNTDYAICDEEESFYPIHYLTYENSPVYFLNLNNNYNYALGTYHEYLEEEDDFFISQYLWLSPVVNFKTHYDYYTQFITRLLWEEMYMTKDFNFCGEEDSILQTKETEYQLVKERVNRVLDGIDIFNNDYTQYENQIVSYEDELLPFYTLVNNSGLDVNISNNKITIQGELGEYYLDFTLKDNYTGVQKTFTDGRNRLATVSHPPFNVYTMHVTIIENEAIEEPLTTEEEEINDDNYFKEEDDEVKEIYINIEDETEDIISFVAKNTFMSSLF